MTSRHQRWFRAALAALALCLLAPACDNSSTPTPDLPPQVDLGSAEQPPREDALASKDASPSTEGIVSRDGPLPCNASLQGQSCEAGSSCSWSQTCAHGSCECVDGAYACTITNTCNETCPTPQETQCGDACAGDLEGCLCRCGGGGPNYSQCDCVSGAWRCVGC